MRAVAVSTALFDGYPMEVAIAEIAASGARHVEPAYIRGYVDFGEDAFTPVAAKGIGTLIREGGLSVTAISAHLDMGLPEAVAMLTRRLDFAARLGAKYVITNTGQKARRGAILRVIDEILPECERLGVGLALENPGHGSGDMIGTGREGAALVAEIGSQWVWLNYDAGNIFTYSREALRPDEDFAAALPAITHLHLKDVASDASGWRFTAVGDGVIDYRALWQVLPTDMPVAIELPLRLERKGRTDPKRRTDPLPLEEIRRALGRSLDFVAGLERT